MKVAVETVQKGEATASNVLKSQSEWPLHNVVLDLKYSATLLSITWLSWWRTAAPWGWLNKAKLSSLFLFFSRRDSGLEMWPVITFFRPAPLGHSVVFALLVDLSRVSAAPFSCSYTLLEERRNQTDRAGDSWTLKYLYISFFFFSLKSLYSFWRWKCSSPFALCDAWEAVSGLRVFGTKPDPRSGSSGGRVVLLLEKGRAASVKNAFYWRSLFHWFPVFDLTFSLLFRLLLDVCVSMCECVCVCVVGRAKPPVLYTKLYVQTQYHAKLRREGEREGKGSITYIVSSFFFLPFSYFLDYCRVSVCI